MADNFFYQQSCAYQDTKNTVRCHILVFGLQSQKQKKCAVQLTGSYSK